MKPSSLIAAGTAVAVVAAGGLLWAGRGAASPGPYVTAVASRGGIEQRFTTGGTVERNNQVVLDFDTPSTVTAVEVGLGDQVRAGQTLAVVDPAALRLGVLQARATLMQAEARLSANLDAQAAGESAAAVAPPASQPAAPPPAPAAQPTAMETPSYLAELEASMGALQGLVEAQQVACQPVFAAAATLGELGIQVPETLPTTMPTTFPIVHSVPPPADDPPPSTEDAEPGVESAPPVRAAPPAQSAQPDPSSEDDGAIPPSDQPTEPPAQTAQPTEPAKPTEPPAQTDQPTQTDQPAEPPAETGKPTGKPTELPTDLPTDFPTGLPTDLPTSLPSLPTEELLGLIGQVQVCAGAMVVLAQAEIQAGTAIAAAAAGLAEANAAAAAALQQAQAELEAAAAAAADEAIRAAQEQLEAQLAAQLGGRVTDATIAADRAQVLQARQELAKAESDLAGASLTSPIAGTVGAISLRPGESSAGGSITIVGPGAATVTIDVPLTVRALTNPGMDAQVGLVGGDLDLPARVDTVAMLADSPGDNPSYRTTLVTDDPDQVLKSGSRAEVSLQLRTVEDVLTVPLSAVTKVTDTTATVQVVENDRATESEQVTIVTGAQGGGRIEVVSGLNAGQLVVLADRRLPIPGGFDQYRALDTDESPTPTPGR